MSQPAKVTYAFDAYCGWCYGFGQAVHDFAAANEERIELEVLSGGLFTGNRALPISAYPHIPGANAEISRLTGVPFGRGYVRTLREGTAVMNSAHPAAGLVALRRQDTKRALMAAGAIQRAWYIDGRNLSDVQVYRDVAAELGLDSQAVTSDYEDPTTSTEVENDFRAVRRLNVESYPTLLLHSTQGLRRLGGPISSADTLQRTLDEYLSPPFV